MVHENDIYRNVSQGKPVRTLEFYSDIYEDQLGVSKYFLSNYYPNCKPEYGLERGV